MTVTPEMLNAESVEKAAEALCIHSTGTSMASAAITAYLNAEIEAGRGLNDHVLWLPDGSWTRAASFNKSPSVFPVLILRLEAGKKG